MDKNCSNLKKEMDKQTQEFQWTLTSINLKKTKVRHNIKLLNISQKKISKISREKILNIYNSVPLIPSADVFKDILQFRVWDDNIQVQKNYQPRTLYMAKLSLKHEGEIKIFSDNLNLKEFMTTGFVLQEVLESPLSIKNGSTNIPYKPIKPCFKVNISTNTASSIIVMLVSKFNSLMEFDRKIYKNIICAC